MTQMAVWMLALLGTNLAGGLRSFLPTLILPACT